MDPERKEEEIMIRFTPLAAAAALAIAVAAPALAQDFSKVEISTEKLNDTTYLLIGAGGNIGVSAGEDALFIIDDQYAPMTPKIVAALAAISPKPVRFVLNTHWHFDHTGGNENFGKAGALIVAHDNVRKRMNSEQFIEFLRMTEKPSPKAALPVVTFGADMTFHINGEEIRALHVPRAHTDGDSIVHFVKGDIVHMGDTFFNGMYPFIDTSSGGNVDGVIACADRVLAMGSDKLRIIPGHGPLATKADLKAYRDMLATVSGRIKQMIREGKKLEEITASGVSADYDEKWGKGFIKANKFAEMIAMNLLRQ
jgi:glyoxylase-like metal-dependent hydrolase (beta-lactamase superfamily II)